MKQRLVFIFLMNLFLSSISLAEDCEKYIGTCEYYLCQEKNKPCGVGGYFIGFGYKYCRKSLDRLMTKVSPLGQEWVARTAICLQEQLEEINNSKSCTQIKAVAIEGHSRCYEEVGFCSLDLSDKVEVLKMITPALRVKGVLSSGVQVLRFCSQNN